MMGVVQAHRRGIAAGARTLLQNTGAVLSIAFVMAVVTAAIPKATLFAIFSGVSKGLSPAKLAPFISNMHTALWVLATVSLIGTFVCLLRPSHVTADVDEEQDAPHIPLEAVAELGVGAYDEEYDDGAVVGHPTPTVSGSSPR
jgi:hypothetical protein